MTKLRDPLTPQAAILEIISHIGWDGAADAIFKDVSAVRKYSDADTARNLSFQDAIRLEIAYRKNGGQNSALLAVFEARILQALGETPMAPKALNELMGLVSKENGEALAAALSAATDNKYKQAAINEIAEAINGLVKLQQKLDGK